MFCSIDRYAQGRKAYNQRAVRLIFWPNMAVKGTRRSLAVLEFGFLSRFDGFVLLSLAARPLLLR
jgi:hypothetical protein